MRLTTKGYAKEVKMDTAHKSVDGWPIEVGARFWDNNLDVVVIVAVAVSSNTYSDTGCTQTWHETNKGWYDTLDGDMRRIGRLVRYFEGLDAEDFKPGTAYGAVKDEKFVKVDIGLTIRIPHELVDDGPNEVIDESYDELSAKIRQYTDAIEALFREREWPNPNVDVDIDAIG